MRSLPHALGSPPMRPGPKLDAADQNEICRSLGLDVPAPLAAGTDDDLLCALDARSLAAWRFRDRRGGRTRRRGSAGSGETGRCERVQSGRTTDGRH